MTALLGVVLLMLHLLQSGGRWTFSAEEAAACSEWTGVEVAAGRQEDLGLRTVVWMVRQTVWGEPLAALYRSFPWLQSNWTAWTTLLMIAAALAGFWGFLGMLSRLSALRAALAVSSRLRQNLHRQALRIGLGEMQNSGQQEAEKLFLRETEVIQNAISNRIFLFGMGLSHFAVFAGLAFLLDWRAALQCLVPLACCWYLLIRHRDERAVQQRAAQHRLQEEREHLTEDFRKARLIRGYGMGQVEQRQFQSALKNYCRHLIRTERRQERACWFTAAGVVLAVVVVLFFIGMKVLSDPEESGHLPLASGVFLLGIWGLSSGVVWRVSQLPRKWNEASAAAEHLFHYLDRIPEVGQAVGAKFLQPLSSSLQLEAVQYDLPDGRPLLKGIDLKLAAGQTYAFVSLNPLEPRALAYLLPRFLEPKSGRILFDGEDIAWVTLESLRAETAYVGGEAPWFAGTVLENIRCGDERKTLQDVTEAAKTVHAHQFITRLPQGYETVLGENNRLLDAGEAFRLALARAMLRDPALMIIEEPSVPLDADTKALLDDAYNRILKNRTVIFLPARLSTVRRADTVVLLHDGRVEAVGQHTALVKSSETYRHWEYIRFNQFRNNVEAAETPA